MQKPYWWYRRFWTDSVEEFAEFKKKYKRLRLLREVINDFRAKYNIANLCHLGKPMTDEWAADVMFIETIISISKELESRGFSKVAIDQIITRENVSKVFDVAHLGECFLMAHRGEPLPTWEGKTTYYE